MRKLEVGDAPDFSRNRSRNGRWKLAVREADNRAEDPADPVRWGKYFGQRLVQIGRVCRFGHPLVRNLGHNRLNQRFRRLLS